METTRAATPSCASRSAASIAVLTSLPVPTITRLRLVGVAQDVGAARHPGGVGVRLHGQVLARERHGDGRVEVLEDHAPGGRGLVGVAGRMTVRPGIARSAARCSTGWCVGPSSPSATESWVYTHTDGRPVSADRRIEPRM